MRHKSRHHKFRQDMQSDDQWQRAWDEPEEMDEVHKQALLKGIHRRMDRRRHRKTQVFLLSLSTAAAILIAVFVKWPHTGAPAGVPAPAWNELASNDVARKVLLEDGSVLWLAPHSVVRIHPDFSAQRSTLLIKGTAFFSVARHEQHPFAITVNRQQVTVLGTAFSIQKLDSVDIKLTVKEGKVALDNTGGRQLLTAAQQVQTKGSVTGTVQTVDPAVADWWLQRQVRWHDISLGDLLNRVESYYHVKLSNGHINRKMKVTLTWDLALSLDDNLAVLNSLTGYHIH